jgi:hypothetical protein
MNLRIYKVLTSDGPRLVRAYNQQAAVSHAARTSIVATPAKPEEIYELARSGVEIEDVEARPRKGRKAQVEA